MRWLAEWQNAIQWGNNRRGDLFRSKHLEYRLLLAAMVRTHRGAGEAVIIEHRPRSARARIQ